MRSCRRLGSRASGVVVLLALLVVASSADAHRLIVGSFNVESGGADIKTVARHVADQKDVDIWGFSEVQNAGAADVLRAAAQEGTGAPMKLILGTTGGADRLAVVLNESRLTFVKHFELAGTIIQACGPKNARAPLVVEFKVKGLDRRIWLMVNHLQRGDNAYRHCQAETLNTWKKTHTVATVAVGDYNFDWSVATSGADHDNGLDLLTAADRFRWVKPEAIVKTHCGPHNSVLDFVFVANRAKQWPAKSTILKPEPEYCTANPDKESDHRPVVAELDAQ